MSISPLILLLILSTLATAGDRVRPLPSHQETSKAEPGRTQYRINLALDFDQRSYEGFERVKWSNQGDHAVSSVFFHLYANIRTDQPARSIANDIGAPDEPRIEVSAVRSAANDATLPFLLDEQATILRVILREPVAPGGITDIYIKFKGSVPEIDPEETGLVTHVIKQVGAAIRGEREIRRARDLNFCSRGVMLLGTAFPLLAVHGGDDGRQRSSPVLAT